MTHFWKNLRIGISGFVASVSCPCHLPATLPIILTLTAGTSLGLWIAHNTITLAVVTTVIFLGSLGLTFYWVNQPEVCPVSEYKGKKKRTRDNIITTHNQ